MSRHLTRGALLLALCLGVGASVLPELAQAQDVEHEGIPVPVVVVDADDQPLRTAVVRHPEERERHRVNTHTGS